MKLRGLGCGSLLLAASVLGCARPSVDPAVAMIAQVDQAPAEKRPPNWEVTRSLMMRPSPKVGESAPDFTLHSPDGKETITRSSFQASRPLVLVFGSFT